jgi:hypothetical protein
MEPDLVPASEMKRLIPGTTDQYWATLRHKGGGPEYVKVGPPGRARKTTAPSVRLEHCYGVDATGARSNRRETRRTESLLTD